MRHVRFDNNFEFDDRDLLDSARRKTLFREIVKDVRDSAPTDLNGALVRAMEKSFKAGLDLGKRNPTLSQPRSSSVQATADQAITMTDINPRARDALETFAICCGRSIHMKSRWRDEVNPILLKKMPADPFSGKEIWLLVRPKIGPRETFGITTLSGLERLGLLAMESSGRYLTLTARGLDMMENERTSFAIPAEPLWELAPRNDPDAPEESGLKPR